MAEPHRHKRLRNVALMILMRHAPHYNQWRYKYPEYDHKPGWVKTIPSQGLNDLIVNALKEDMD